MELSENQLLFVYGSFDIAVMTIEYTMSDVVLLINSDWKAVTT